jgi:hypothetical protein
MIDPKQGPLFRPARGAESSARPKRHPAGTAPEDRDAGKRPFVSKRQFSLVGSERALLRK